MYMYTYTIVHICVCVWVCGCVNTHTHTPTHTQTHPHTHTHNTHIQHTHLLVNILIHDKRRPTRFLGVAFPDLPDGPVSPKQVRTNVRVGCGVEF